MSNTVPTETREALGTMAQRLADELDRWDHGRFHAEHPQQREAASNAVDLIDVMLRTLHWRRSELVSETRAYDDESMRRTDALLARIRAEREARVS